MELKRVVVTGLGAITPVGNTLEATWNSLLNGVSGAAPIQGFDASRFKTQFACEVKDFKAADFIDRKEIRKWISMNNMQSWRQCKLYKTAVWTSKRSTRTTSV